MQDQFSRTRLLMGKPAIDTLKEARVAVFGIGGVGGYAVEVLARSGVGTLDIFDNDRVCLTNVNRQIYALLSTVGRHKVDVAEQRIHDINQQCTVNKHQMFYLPDNADEIDLAQFDYVVDCVDTVTAKLELMKRCYRLRVPIISCMGAANKLVQEISVFDVYRGTGLPEGMKSMAVKVILRDMENTLTDETVEPVIGKLIDAATAAGAQLRS